MAETNDPRQAAFSAVKFRDSPYFLWFVGLYEGEGSCGSQDGNLRLSIKMTDLDVLEQAQSTVGSGVIFGPYERSGKNWKPCWDFVLTKSDEAAALFEEMLPYLKSRRQDQVRTQIVKYKESQAAIAARRNPSTRFWNMVEADGSCLIWQGGKHATGAGSFSIEHSTHVLAHKFAWEDWTGEAPVKYKNQVATCGNTLCVNPWHRGYNGNQ